MPVVQAVVVLSREAELVAPLTLLPKGSGPPSCGPGPRNPQEIGGSCLTGFCCVGAMVSTDASASSAETGADRPLDAPARVNPGLLASALRDNRIPEDYGRIAAVPRAESAGVAMTVLASCLSIPRPPVADRTSHSGRDMQQDGAAEGLAGARPSVEATLTS